MSWEEFVAGWALAFDGYNMRHASPARRRWMRAAHRVALVLARCGVRPSATMVLSAAASVAVALCGWRGGGWPIAGALALLAGLGADTLTLSLSVVSGAVTRLRGFYQSLLDRLAEVCWLAAFVALGAHAVLAVVCGALVWAHEYLRARSTLRRAGTSTLGDRPARVWLSLAGLVLAGLIAQLGQDLAAGIVTLIVFSWAALAFVGIGQLLAIIRKVLA